jgi:hypothetical protein
MPCFDKIGAAERKLPVGSQGTDAATLANKEVSRRRPIAGSADNQENHGGPGKVSGHEIDVFDGNGRVLPGMAAIEANYRIPSYDPMPADPLCKFLLVPYGEHVRRSCEVFACYRLETDHFNDNQASISPHSAQQKAADFAASSRNRLASLQHFVADLIHHGEVEIHRQTLAGDSPLIFKCSRGFIHLGSKLYALRRDRSISPPA